MPLAVTLRLDPAAAAPIEALWRILAAQGIDDALRLGYPPHVTLALYPDDAAAAGIGAAVSAVSGDWDALPLAVAGYRVFPGPPAVLWAAPVVTARLLSRHAALHRALSGFPGDPHYRPDAWVPHITLSAAADPLAAALSALMPAWARPITGTLNRLDIVRFSPVAVIWTRERG